MKKVDDNIKLLLNELEKRQHLFDAHIFIVSDHGMSNVNKSKVIILKNYINEDCLLTSQPSYSVYGLWPRTENCHNMLVANLTGIEHLHVYEKKNNNIPPQYNYHKNIRIAPILLETDLGWALVRSEDEHARMIIGEHGWNNSHEDMQSIFFAIGNNFNKTQSSSKRTTNNVEIYNLMCNILKVPAAPNNGTQYLIDLLIKK